MTISFTGFSGAITAALASRSHEWLEWEIRECEQITHVLRQEIHVGSVEIPTHYVSVSLSLPTDDPQFIGHACLKFDPRTDSPSAGVTRLLREARAQRVPVFHFSDWRSNLGTKSFYDFEPELVADAMRFLATLRAEVAPRAGGRTWSIEGSVSSFKIRNSLGLLASFTETEVNVKVNARTVYSGRRCDPRELRRELESL